MNKVQTHLHERRCLVSVLPQMTRQWATIKMRQLKSLLSLKTSWSSLCMILTSTASLMWAQIKRGRWPLRQHCSKEEQNSRINLMKRKKRGKLMKKRERPRMTTRMRAKKTAMMQRVKSKKRRLSTRSTTTRSRLGRRTKSRRRTCSPTYS